MNWLIMLGTILAIVVVAIIRQHMLKSRPEVPAIAFELREPMAFEEFYASYYRQSGLSDAVVFKLLEFISMSSGIEYKLIRPEDSLDGFPKGSLRKHVLEFAEMMVKAKQRIAVGETGNWFDPNIKTVDDFIRKLGPLATKVEEHHRQLHL